MQRNFAMTLLLGLLVTTAACGGASDSDQEQVVSKDPAANVVAGKTLVATGITEADSPRPLVKGSRIRFEFTGSDVQITAGCNTMNGSYTLEEERLEVGPLASTEMACPEPLMDQELWVSELLEEPVTMEGGEEFTLTAGDVVLTLEDRKNMTPDASLTGTTWQLDSLIDGESATSAPTGNATITLDGSGNIKVRSYCNNGAGKVTVGDGTMDIGAIMMTMRACEDPEKGKAESAMKKVLNGEVSFEIEEKRLTITKGGQALEFTTK